LLRRNLIANYLGQGWTALVGLAFIPFYVRHLGLEAYGLIGLFAALQAWLTIIDLGMTPTLGREMARFTGGQHTPQSIRTLLRTIEAIALLVAVFVGLGVWLVSGWIATSWVQAETLDPATVVAAIGLSGVVIALRFLEGLYRSAVVGLERQVAYNFVSAGMATLRAAGAVGVLVWVTPSIIAFFMWQAAMSIVSVALLVGLTYRILPRTEKFARPSIAALKPVYSFAGGMVGITILAAVLTQVDKVLLSRLLPLSDFGTYTLAATVAGALYLFVSPITQAFYPRFCAQVAASDDDGFTATYHTAAQLVSVVAGSAAVVVIFFSEQLIWLWTGDAILATEIAVLLSTLMLGNLLHGLMHMPYMAQLAYGWTSLATRVNVVAICIIIPLILWMTPLYGAQGAAWVWVYLNAGYVFIGSHFMYRHILVDQKLNWLIYDLFCPLFAATIAAYFSSITLDGSNNLLGAFVDILLAALCTFSAAFFAASTTRTLALKKIALLKRQ
jgi:O-antigen/teichoic acid export membrane protein